ncbi:MAG TPA: CDP-diacylglycerol--glycerol-3-phosphate 3-phosphatidyltransferase [bacterium]|nr:CDP-diacylglycerol--glycerol-3-phosphate 3-phosphatidyltransferase [bacterium]
MSRPKPQNRASRWNIANILTLSRIGVTPLYLILIFREEVWAKWAAGLLFAWGAISDYLDGYYARKYNLKTDFGALLDPFADKVLIVSVFVSFVALDLVPAWMVVIMVGREFLITGFRQVAQTQNIILAASRAGKHKTVSQIVAISVILAIVCAQSTVEAYQGTWDQFILRLGGWGEFLDKFVWYGPYWLMFYATVMSIISGVDYFYKNRHILGGPKR